MLLDLEDDTRTDPYYSDNCFGTADAILFRNNFLRIHDLKTGKIPAHMEQLEIYAALFCLEYKVKPGDIEMELRIYQNNEILYHNPTAEDIVPIMDRIITFDKVIKRIREQEGVSYEFHRGRYFNALWYAAAFWAIPLWFWRESVSA